uniref:Cytochrome P450 n=1 Tax=Solanum lycopersicum TaxID=4081 RepID=A0A3Q7I533_SOLLC
MNLKLGHINTVVTSSSILAKQVTQRQNLSFSRRSIPDGLYACNHSVVWLPVNSQWRTLRKNMNSHIMPGNNIDVSKHLRREKVQELIENCHKSVRNCEAVNVGRAEFKDLMGNIMVEAGKPNLVYYSPFLEKIDPQGTDATSNTFEWAMAELLKNLHILEKAQEELAQVIVKGKLIDEADVTELPYLRCIVKETIRIHPQSPFLIPRKAEEDVELSGYIISKDSQVLVNVWEIGHDASLWEDPLDVKPERFWESDMDIRDPDFELIPFDAC